MAQSFLSPGVETVEVDQTFLPTATPVPGAIFIGRTLKGRAYFPLRVASLVDYQNRFGGVDPYYQLPYAAQNYLQNSTNLTVVRVLGSADGTQTNNGYSNINVIGICDTSGAISTTGSILAVIHCSASLTQVFISGVAGDANNFTFKLGNAAGNGYIYAVTASFLTSSDNFVAKSLNTDPTQYATYGHYLYQNFQYQKQAASASWQPAGLNPYNYTAFNRDYVFGTTTNIKSQLIGGVEYDLFQIITLGDGRAANDQIKVQIANVRPSTVPNTNPFGAFDILVRSFYDTDQRPVVLERFSNLNLDPTSPNYVSIRIGDRYEQFNTTTRKFAVTNGQYPNRSQYIRINMLAGPGLANAPPNSLPFGFRGYPTQRFSGSLTADGGANGIAVVQQMPYTPNQIDYQGNYNPAIIWGVSFVSGGIVDRMRAWPDGVVNTVAAALPITGTDPDFSLKSLSGTYVNGNLRYNYAAGYLGYTASYGSASLQTFTMPFIGGFDGFDLRLRDPLFLQYQDGTSVLGVVSQQRAVDCVANPDQVIGNTLALPGQYNQSVTDYARALVNTRQDLFYVMDLTGSTPQEVVNNLSPRNIDDNYTAGYYPDLLMMDTVNNKVVRVSPSVGVMGALAYNDRVAQAFFAPAGLNRGGLSQFGVIDTVDRLNHADRDLLYDSHINPITRFPNEGIVVFGQKTMQARPSALDRVNVRRLLILAKATVAAVARGLLFEPNNPSTWTRFVNKVNPILDSYRVAQGINRFKVVMDSTTNTPDRIDRNEMYGKIFLEPTQAAEYITIDFILTPAGVQFAT